MAIKSKMKPALPWLESQSSAGLTVMVIMSFQMQSMAANMMIMRLQDSLLRRESLEFQNIVTESNTNSSLKQPRKY